MIEFQPDAEPSFNTLKNNDYASLIKEKWGLDSIRFESYTFTGDATVPDPNSFLIKLLTSKVYKITEIKAQQLTTQSVGKKFFTKLWKSTPQLARDIDGHPIIKAPDNHFHNMWLCDRLQNGILDEDSEEFDVFSDADRKELIFQLMKLLVIGGVYCQFEDNFDVYEPVIVSLYKDMIGQSVVKEQSGAISVVARAFLITSVNGMDAVADEDRGAFIVVIDVIGKRARVVKYNTVC